MKILKLLFVSVLLGGCVAGEYNAPAHLRVFPGSSANKPYQLTTSTEVARVGETSQRFEIRHDDCGRDYDCHMDRRRIEVTEGDRDAHARVGDVRWYGWSMYLPSNFREISPTNTHVGQIKLSDWRSPLWAMNIRENQLIVDYRPQGGDAIWCRTVSLQQMRGRWTDIVVYANYNYENPSSGPMLQAWVNGRPVCSDNRPLVTPEMVRTAGRTEIRFRYGIYNSYVSRWLNANRTRAVATTGFADYHADSGATHNSAAARPFEIDWGVELPTQVLFYDEVRIGRSREDVDVRLRTNQ
jgi:hypothetical protein